MKPIRDLFGNLRPLFESGGRFAYFRPVFDAAEAFFFGSWEPVSGPPFVRDALDIKRLMTVVIVALLPALAVAAAMFGPRIFLMIVVSYLAGGLVEVVFAVLRKEPINEGFLVTGLIFPLTLPPGLPLWLVALGVAFGVTFGKELFGGTGRNMFNPALAGRCFLAIGYPSAMAAGWIMPLHGFPGRLFTYTTSAMADAVTSATPLVQAKQGTLVPLHDLIVGNVAGSMGETSAAAVVIGGVFLLFTKIGSWRTVVSILASAFALQYCLHAAAPATAAPAFWHLCAGGLLFGAFFMATDPVTSPSTNAGKYIYGAIIGAVTMLIRNFSGYVEGVTFAILIGNMTAPLLDEIVYKISPRRGAA
jgi:Na+-transporting NADH:ubiquinone oxidoreductase subunit B